MHLAIRPRLSLSSPSTPPVPHVDVRTLYVNHHAWLLGWLRKRMRHGDHAADLAHDIFVQILGKPEQLQELRQPRAWLSTVARGVLVDRVRRQVFDKKYYQGIASNSTWSPYDVYGDPCNFMVTAKYSF